MTGAKSDGAFAGFAALLFTSELTVGGAASEFFDSLVCTVTLEALVCANTVWPTRTATIAKAILAIGLSIIIAVLLVLLWPYIKSAASTSVPMLFFIAPAVDFPTFMGVLAIIGGNA